MSDPNPTDPTSSSLPTEAATAQPSGGLSSNQIVGVVIGSICESIRAKLQS